MRFCANLRFCGGLTNPTGKSVHILILFENEFFFIPTIAACCFTNTGDYRWTKERQTIKPTLTSIINGKIVPLQFTENKRKTYEQESIADDS